MGKHKVIILKISIPSICKLLDKILFKELIALIT